MRHFSKTTSTSASRLLCKSAASVCGRSISYDSRNRREGHKPQASSPLTSLPPSSSSPHSQAVRSDRSGKSVHLQPHSGVTTTTPHISAHTSTSEGSSSSSSPASSLQTSLLKCVLDASADDEMCAAAMLSEIFSMSSGREEREGAHSADPAAVPSTLISQCIGTLLHHGRGAAALAVWRGCSDRPCTSYTAPCPSGTVTDDGGLRSRAAAAGGRYRLPSSLALRLALYAWVVDGAASSASDRLLLLQVSLLEEEREAPGAHTVRGEGGRSEQGGGSAAVDAALASWLQYELSFGASRRAGVRIDGDGAADYQAALSQRAQDFQIKCAAAARAVTGLYTSFPSKVPTALRFSFWLLLLQLRLSATSSGLCASTSGEGSPSDTDGGRLAVFGDAFAAFQAACAAQEHSHAASTRTADAWEALCGAVLPGWWASDTDHQGRHGPRAATPATSTPSPPLPLLLPDGVPLEAVLSQCPLPPPPPPPSAAASRTPDGKASTAAARKRYGVVDQQWWWRHTPARSAERLAFYRQLAACQAAAQAISGDAAAALSLQLLSHPLATNDGVLPPTLLSDLALPPCATLGLPLMESLSYLAGALPTAGEAPTPQEPGHRELSRLSPNVSSKASAAAATEAAAHLLAIPLAMDCGGGGGSSVELAEERATRLRRTAVIASQLGTCLAKRFGIRSYLRDAGRRSTHSAGRGPAVSTVPSTALIDLLLPLQRRHAARKHASTGVAAVLPLSDHPLLARAVALTIASDVARCKKERATRGNGGSFGLSPAWAALLGRLLRSHGDNRHNTYGGSGTTATGEKCPPLFALPLWDLVALRSVVWFGADSVEAAALQQTETAAGAGAGAGVDAAETTDRQRGAEQYAWLLQACEELLAQGHTTGGKASERDVDSYRVRLLFQAIAHTLTAARRYHCRAEAAALVEVLMSSPSSSVAPSHGSAPARGTLLSRLFDALAALRLSDDDRGRAVAGRCLWLCLAASADAEVSSVDAAAAATAAKEGAAASGWRAIRAVAASHRDSLLPTDDSALSVVFTLLECHEAYQGLLQRLARQRAHSESGGTPVVTAADTAVIEELLEKHGGDGTSAMQHLQRLSRAAPFARIRDWCYPATAGKHRLQPPTPLTRCLQVAERAGRASSPQHPVTARQVAGMIVSAVAAARTPLSQIVGSAADPSSAANSKSLRDCIETGDWCAALSILFAARSSGTDPDADAERALRSARAALHACEAARPRGCSWQGAMALWWRYGAVWGGGGCLGPREVGRVATLLAHARRGGEAVALMRSADAGALDSYVFSQVAFAVRASSIDRLRRRRPPPRGSPASGGDAEGRSGEEVLRLWAVWRSCVGAAAPSAPVMTRHLLEAGVAGSRLAAGSAALMLHHSALEQLRGSGADAAAAPPVDWTDDAVAAAAGRLLRHRWEESWQAALAAALASRRPELLSEVLVRSPPHYAVYAAAAEATRRWGVDLGPAGRAALVAHFAAASPSSSVPSASASPPSSSPGAASAAQPPGDAAGGGDLLNGPSAGFEKRCPGDASPATRSDWAEEALNNILGD